MIHTGSGYRGTRAGVAAGSRTSLQGDSDHGNALPRMRVSYWCAKGHETVAVFLKMPDDQIPVTWDCRRCGGQASRDGQSAAQQDAGEEVFKTAYRVTGSESDAEDVLAGALERLRASGILPD